MALACKKRVGSAIHGSLKRVWMPSRQDSGFRITELVETTRSVLKLQIHQRVDEDTETTPRLRIWQDLCTSKPRPPWPIADEPRQPRPGPFTLGLPGHWLVGGGFSAQIAYGFRNLIIAVSMLDNYK
ncbi:hypothetical protein PM082_021536 [Marasmius tenuissimus]|nr:hypothetical protein PM082_021536 [Marasmius tenuissimus]